MTTPSAEKCCWEMWWTCPIWIPEVWALERPVGRCIWPIPHAQLEPGGVSSGDRLRFEGVSIDSSTIEAAQCFEKVHWGYQERQHITRSVGSWVDLWVTINIHLIYTKKYPVDVSVYYQYLSVNPVNPVDVSIFHVFPCFIHFQYPLYIQLIFLYSMFPEWARWCFFFKPKAWYSKDGRLWFEHHLESWRCQELQGWPRFLEVER